VVSFLRGLVDGDRRLLVKTTRLVVPVRAERPERRFYGAGVVAAEKKLTPGGAENNPDIRLCSATIAPVDGG
jgi:hypothetical protein